MCYLDIYSKKSFDMYEDVLMYIHPSRTYAWSFCCIACGFFFFFLREQINISLVFFFPFLLFFFSTLLLHVQSQQCSLQQKLKRLAGCFSTTRLKWEAYWACLTVSPRLSEGSAPRHLHYSILLTCLLAHTAIETGFLSAVEAHSVQERAGERIEEEIEESGERKREREWVSGGGVWKYKEAHTERGESVCVCVFVCVKEREREWEWGINRGKVRDTVTGEYKAVTADWISGSNRDALSVFFVFFSFFLSVFFFFFLLPFFADWFLWLDFSAVKQVAGCQFVVGCDRQHGERTQMPRQRWLFHLSISRCQPGVTSQLVIFV